MIHNCEGCIYELCDAIYQQDIEGLYLATCDKYPMSHPDNKGHFGMIMVNKDGEVVMS